MKYPLTIFFLCSSLVFAEDKLVPVSKYDDFVASGLEAEVMYIGDTGMAFGIKPVDKTKELPSWMRALYISNLSGTAWVRKYQYDMKNPSRVSAYLGWDTRTPEALIVIGPVLRDDETFSGKQYIAISTKDLVAWRGKKK